MINDIIYLKITTTTNDIKIKKLWIFFLKDYYVSILNKHAFKVKKYKEDVEVTYIFNPHYKKRRKWGDLIATRIQTKKNHKKKK